LDCIQRWLKTRSACPLCNKVSRAHSSTRLFSAAQKRLISHVLSTLLLQEWEFSKIEKIMPGNEGAAAE
jgi:hypothetical protein